jgi:hypothetical protein
MKQMTDLIEICAGTAAVSLAALGAPKFPAARIGGKAGYAEAILDALEIGSGAARHVVLVEPDPRLARILRALLGPGRETLAAEIEERLAADPREVWEAAKRGVRASDDLLWLAGARGGIGGFKGKHVLRERVDGFIPSRPSLAKRVRAFAPFEGRATVLETDASSLDPSAFAPTKVYIDPPYLGRQGYAKTLREPVQDLAERWAAAGHLVIVSEGRPLPAADTEIDITARRRGQARKSLTTCDREWLSVFDPAAVGIRAAA